MTLDKAKALKEIRLKMCLSQEDYGILFGLSRRQIQEREYGTVEIETALFIDCILMYGAFIIGGKYDSKRPTESLSR